MTIQDGNQWNAPENKPKGKGSDPRLPEAEEKDNIRRGAREEDQLKKLKPESNDDSAPGEFGSPPVEDVEQGDK